MKKLLILLLFISLQAEAQFCPECVDPTIIPNEFQPCGTDFMPVCGCNGTTYRNICSAIFWGGLCSWTDGICSGLFLDMYPTAVTYFDPYVNLYTNVTGPLTLFIYDTYGRIKYQRNINIRNPGNQTINGPERIPTQNLDLGIYILLAVSGNESQYIKFAKVIKSDD